MGISPVYDPTLVSTVKAELDLSDLNTFLVTPVPHESELQCYVVRQKGGIKNMLYPKYELYMSDGDKFLLAAKKR